MLLAFLIWFQAPQGHISRLVIAVVVLLFIAAIGLLVHFLRKLQAHEKADDDWSLSRRSLFTESAGEATTTEAASEGAAGAGSLSPVSLSEPASPAPSATQVLASRTAETASEEDFRVTQPEMRVPIGPAAPTPPPEPPVRKTELFASLRSAPPPAVPVPPVVEPAAKRPDEAPSAEPIPQAATEVLSTPRAVPPPVPPVQRLDAASPAGPPEAGAVPPPPVPPMPPPAATREFSSPIADQVPREAARVQARPPKAPFEAPVIEPVRTREPFEAPVVTPLTPRDQTALLGAPKVSPPRPPQEPGPATPPADLYREPPRAHSQRDFREGAWSGDVGAAAGNVPAAPAWEAPAIAEAPAMAPGARAARRPAGAVLGLPAEASHAPLVLGTPVKARDEIGIGGLSGYGKVDKSGGRGGLVVLLVALVLVGAAVLAYFYVPSFHNRVANLMLRARGIDPDAELMSKARAMIIPTPSFADDNNNVKAKGTVQNLTDAQLEGLTMDLQLKRKTGEVESRSVTVSPADLGPKEQGTYEFEYDGGADGFASYSVLRLMSNGRQVRFSFPGQK